MLLSQIVTALGGVLVGEDKTIHQLLPLDEAQANDITFLANPKYKKHLVTSMAGAIIVKTELQEAAQAEGRSLIVCADPYLYFAKVATLFHPNPIPNSFIHPQSAIEEGVEIGAGTHISAFVFIGKNSKIGRNCWIHPSVSIAENCEIGDDTVIFPNVTIYHSVKIGQRVRLHAGCVIGADGFGLAWDKDHWFKIPQTGTVIIEDDVEVGANTTIDRGALKDTHIHADVKIDNLVQIGHNVKIGAHTAIAGCTGIAGSTKIGANCTLGGAVMMVGHIEIADRTFIGGGTLVSKSITEAAHYASSYPLSTYRDWLKNAAHLRNLDTLASRVKSLEQTLQTNAQA